MIKELEIKQGYARQEFLYYKKIAKDIYDYYLTYPPDWEERKIEILQRGKFCQNCGNHSRLHVHHDIPLGKGGTNKQDNLILLCEVCHKKTHGVHDFKNEFGDVSGALNDRIDVIRKAIFESRVIEFYYKKPTDASFIKRIVTPYEMLAIPHHDGINSTLCVRGYCSLREAERTFALKRMKKLKIL